MKEVFLLRVVWEDEFHEHWQQKMNLLPLSWQNEIKKYRFETDRNRSIASKWMLLQMLKKWGYEPSDLKQQKDVKPYLVRPGQPPYFSVSKSEKHVVLGWSWEIELGVDIEIERKTHWQVFRSRISESVWSEITKSQNPLDTFLFCWTHLEAILKLNGTGIANHIKNIELIDNQWYQYGNHYQIFHRKIQNYYLTLAARQSFQIAEEFVFKWE